MPGRFTHHIPWDELREFMNLMMEDPPMGYSHRYNIAPTQLAAVIRADEHGDGGGRRMDMFRWGLAPRWSRDAERGPINARIESAREKPTFREAMVKRRCIIPASGFYEWQLVAPGKPKQPLYITPIGTPIFAFAGLWESHPEIGYTFCILTTEPNALMRPIHDRMGVILTPAQFDEWLSTDPLRFDPAKPFPEQFMAVRPVGKKVNATKNDDPSLIEPVAKPGLF